MLKVKAERIDAITTPALGTLPSVSPTDLELSFDSKDELTIVILWVGMLPSGRMTSANDDAVAEEVSAKGKSVNNLKKLDLIKTDPKAMRVVCPSNWVTVFYYALTKQDPTTKLCAGVMVKMDDVYFFPEFRDNQSTSVNDRKNKWPEKVRKALGRTQRVERDANRTYDKTKFPIAPEQALASE